MLAKTHNSMDIVRGERAQKLLKDDVFCNQWRRLEQNCPWGTVFQSHTFATTWYHVYHEVYEPVLITGWSENELSGLFLLAYSMENRKLVHVGGHHAEYQTWLARSESNYEFVLQALIACRDLGASTLHLHFGAPGMPLGWVASAARLGILVNVTMHTRGLMTLGQNSQIADSLRKKSNRSKLKRLSRLGVVSLQKLETRADLETVLDSVAEHCDIRQGAIHSSLPFTTDPLKRTLYLAFMETPGVLHATVLRAGAEIIAAHIGPIDRDYVSLGIISHSPFAAAHSPGKLLLLLLGELLTQEGYACFDLTPGGDYKERFASTSDQVPSLYIALTKKAAIHQKKRIVAVKTIKALAQACRIDLHSVRTKTKEASSRLRRLRLESITDNALRILSRWLFSTKEFRIYQFNPSSTCLPFSSDIKMRVNCISDLLKYVPSGGSDPTVSAFLGMALERLEAGQVVFTYATEDLLLHRAWLIPSTLSGGSEYGHRIHFPKEVTILWDDATHPVARGQGLHQKSLYARCRYAAEQCATDTILIGVSADNAPSRHNIEKMGFSHVGSAWLRTRLGRSCRWIDGAFLLEDKDVSGEPETKNVL